MTEAERRSRQIDRDRRAAEIAAMLALLPLLGAAAEHAAQAFRLGTSATDAAAAVLNGNAALHQPGLGQILASAGTAAWLLGFYRSHAVAAELTTGRPVGMGTYRQAVRGTPNLMAPPAQHADVIGRMIDRAGGATVIRKRFDTAVERARPVVRNIEARVNQRLNRITVGGPALEYAGTADGVHLPDAIGRAMADARVAFERAGVGHRTSWYIDERRPKAGEPNVSANAEAIVEAVVGQDYEQGRAAGATAAAAAGDNDANRVKRVLWGWTWSSVIDGRRCKYCRKLHGTTAPLDDPLWLQFGPLLHFGCRCSRLERYAIGDKTPTVRRPDMSDADIIEAVRMRQSLTTWWQGLPDQS